MWFSCRDAGEVPCEHASDVDLARVVNADRVCDWLDSRLVVTDLEVSPSDEHRLFAHNDRLIIERDLYRLDRNELVDDARLAIDRRNRFAIWTY